MTWLDRPRSLLREGAASARSAPVASVLVMVVIAGMLVAIMLTTGRTVGAEQQVLTSIDSAGTRSVVVRAEDGAGVTSDIVQRIATISGVEWYGAFSSASDATNSQIPDGTRVGVRYGYGPGLEQLGVPAGGPLRETDGIWGTQEAMKALGFDEAAGSIRMVSSGVTYGVAGVIDAPEFLAGFEPLVVIPPGDSLGTEPVNLVLVIADAPEQVGAVAAAVGSVIAATDPSLVTVQTSEALAQLRSLVGGQLASLSRGLLVGMLAVSAGLIGALLYSTVMMRRRDYGRRRALGATRSTIVALVLVQTGLLALAGIVAGMSISTGALLILGDPLPPPAFFLALALLTFVAAVVAAVLPALVASRRDPLRELRVA
jgi:putative ABC transport system permease protein